MGCAAREAHKDKDQTDSYDRSDQDGEAFRPIGGSGRQDHRRDHKKDEGPQGDHEKNAIA